MNGLTLARRMVRRLHGVTVGVGRTDEYRPEVKHVFLSKRTAAGDDMRAQACAAHEAAHAVQHVRLHRGFRLWRSWLVQSELVPICLFFVACLAAWAKWHPWPVAACAACVALLRVFIVLRVEWEATTIALGWLRLHDMEHPDTERYLRRLWRSYLWLAIGL